MQEAAATQLEVNVEALYLDINEFVEPVLVVFRGGIPKCIKEGTPHHSRILKSKTERSRVLGTYDFMVTQQQLREDVHAFGAKIV